MATTIEWAEVAPHLTGFAHLATVTPDGRPHVSKVAPAVDGDIVWIATRASSRKARNVAATPRVAVMWEPQAEVYVQAEAELVADDDTRARIWDSGMFAFPMASFFGSADHPDFVLIRLTPTAATVMIQGASGIERRTWSA